jgi:hypothetical protein
MTENPFNVLTAVVAPAILTNACSVLALGTSNRIARVVERARVVVASLSTLPAGMPAHTRRQQELGALKSRSRLLRHALRIIYGALGGFAAAAMLSVIGALASYYDRPFLMQLAAAVALLAGLAAVAGLVTGCSLMVTETGLALQSVDQDVEEALASQ